MTVTARDQHPERSSRDAWLTRAWTAVALLPVFFVLGFAAGEIVYSLLGYKPENDDAPLWVDLVGSAAALAICLVPCVGAMFYGRRASKTGSRTGFVPMGIGALAAVALVVLTALST